MEQNWLFAKRINILARLFSKRLNEKIVSLGLTSSQWGLVNHLRLHGELTQAEICEQLSLEASTVSRALCAMEAAAWIHRIVDGNDRREKKVGLTAKATETIPACLKVARSLQERSIEGILPEDLIVFDRVLEKISANLRQDHESESRI
jgi:MarR family transcriptional regulator, transcriptional regulator for hemolysin